MLYTEFNIDEAKEVWQEEAREERDIEIARNLLAEGSTAEFVHKTTGLDLKTIQDLSK